MKSNFRHFIKLTDKEKDSIWDDALFVFDTNALLSLYRCSEETRNAYLDVISDLDDKVWIPYHVAEEFFANRLTVIHSQFEEYQTNIDSVNELKEKLQSAHKAPFVSLETLQSIDDSFEKLVFELEENKKKYADLIHDDEILPRILDAFQEKIGPYLEPKELELIIKDGEDRYKNNIPPGYKDSNKKTNLTDLKSRAKPYGDLIIWKQIMQKAHDNKANVVFITNDSKEDWWQKFKGETLGPRVELLSEFHSQTNKNIIFYPSHIFLDIASSKSDKPLSSSTYDELKFITVNDELIYSVPTLNEAIECNTIDCGDVVDMDEEFTESNEFDYYYKMYSHLLGEIKHTNLELSKEKTGLVKAKNKLRLNKLIKQRDEVLDLINNF